MTGKGIHETRPCWEWFRRVRELKPDEIVTKKIYQAKSYPFLTVTWTLQDIFAVVEKRGMQVSFAQLEAIAATLRSQLEDRSVEKGWQVIKGLLADATNQVVKG